MTKGVYRRQTKEETVRKIALLQEMQSMPLHKKIDITNKVLNATETKFENNCLLFSGGKDSTVLLHLMKKAGYNFFAMYNNTTLGDPKADEFTRSIVKKFDVEYIETTANNPVKMWQEKGYFPILSKQWFMRYKKENPSLRINPVQCCYQLKEKYSNKVLTARKVKNVFWGNRADESQRRKFSFVDNGFYFKPKKYKWHQCYPIQHWTRKDVIDYLNIHIPNYPVTANFESGCLCCGTDIQKQFNTLKKLHDADYQKWLYYMRAGFGSEILKIKGVDPKKLEQVIKNKKEILFRI